MLVVVRRQGRLTCNKSSETSSLLELEVKNVEGTEHRLRDLKTEKVLEVNSRQEEEERPTCEGTHICFQSRM